jgi:hypothetical protein
MMYMRTVMDAENLGGEAKAGNGGKGLPTYEIFGLL